MVSRQRQRQAGFTLIELMIAILVGTFLIGGVIAVFMGTYRSNVEDLRITHLNQELRGTMALITRDLKRAGYDSDAIQNVISNNLPISAFTELNTYTSAGWTGSGDCVLFAYDRDEDGALDSGDRLGFRYNGTDRVVEMRSSGSVLTSCDDGTWANINDERTIVIENFDVVEWLYSVGSADERRLQITLDGAVNLRGNPTDISSGDPLEIVRRSYTESVRVRNDEL